MAPVAEFNSVSVCACAHRTQLLETPLQRFCQSQRARPAGATALLPGPVIVRALIASVATRRSRQLGSPILPTRATLSLFLAPPPSDSPNSLDPPPPGPGNPCRACGGTCRGRPASWSGRPVAACRSSSAAALSDAATWRSLWPDGASHSPSQPTGRLRLSLG